ncbi:MAG: hypothetical protein KBC84_01390 [Proteobacteria bacterium]|nr:hypothetical protein [Pseudomonadota bacterium]
MKKLLLIISLILYPQYSHSEENIIEQFKTSRENAEVYNQVSQRVNKVLKAVLKEADPKTSLIPNFFYLQTPDLSKRHRRKLNIYSPHNSGGDLYPFLVLGAYFTEEPLVNGRLMEILKNEIRYTNNEYQVPLEYNFKKEKKFNNYLFGAGEYAKDGLISITERLGRNAWYYRMHDMIIGVMETSDVDTKFGKIPAKDTELNGDLLQVLPRLYYMSGDKRFLEWNRRISDAYIYEILPKNNGLPTKNWSFKKERGSEHVRFRDHGNETIVGLSMSFAMEKWLNSDRVSDYQKTLTIMFDKILESANADGLLYDEIEAQTLKPKISSLADSWGYVYGAVYNFYLMTGETKYKDAVVKVLNNIPKYVDYPWEGEHYDGIADSVEGAIYLINREPNQNIMPWIEKEMLRIFKQQQSDGHVDRSYLEGNFIRTSLLYMEMKSQGVDLSNWTTGAGVGAEQRDGKLFFTIQTPTTGKSWNGLVRFDFARHQRVLNLPLNIIRLNETPEWFVVDENTSYDLYSVTKSTPPKFFKTYLGSELINGIGLFRGDWLLQKTKT